MDYKSLAMKPAIDYLGPENFRTDWDGNLGSSRREEKYREGLAWSAKAVRITIGINSVWGATLKDGGTLTSYEGIGYHSGTADLLRGFLDGPAEVVVYRHDGSRTVIKPAKVQEHSDLRDIVSVNLDCL